jgi:Tfp pilus assembly protein PilF
MMEARLPGRKRGFLMLYQRLVSAALAVVLVEASTLPAGTPDTPPADSRGSTSSDGPPAAQRKGPAEPAATARPGAATDGGENKPAPTGAAAATARGGVAWLPLVNLPPAKIVPNLCLLRYRVSTTSPQCQAFVDQGLGYFYSYVWMEAARSFETATQLDPDCAMAWWCLSRALDPYGKGDKATKALLKADALKSHASDREQQLIRASMQQKGQAPGAGDGEARKKAAIATIDNLLAMYDDDEEAWYFRAQLAGGAGGFGGQVSAIPYYKALLRVNPLHPGANHELVHFYENYRRPALGMPYAEKYIESSPGIPHAFHMQAHLATRIGRWKLTSDRSARAIELERAYQQDMGVKPAQDQQFPHHMEVLLLSLIHDGRFTEGRAIEKEALAAKLKMAKTLFRLHLAERAWDDALRIAADYGKSDKQHGSYLAALVYLRKEDNPRALAEIEVLQEAYQHREGNKADKELELRLWETQGIYLCQTGAADPGLKLLARCVDRTKDDFNHHSWGNGAYYLEAWGAAALRCHKDAVAEEAYLEALAHDPGSVRAALGLQILCERLGRVEEAKRYGELASRCWGRAEVRHLEAERAALQTETVTAAVAGASAAATP